VWVFRFAAVLSLITAATFFTLGKYKISLVLTIFPLFFFSRWVFAYYGFWQTSQWMEFYDTYPDNDVMASFFSRFFDLWDLAVLTTTIGLGGWQSYLLKGRIK
jgi:hypothetical protein